MTKRYLEQIAEQDSKKIKIELDKLNFQHVATLLLPFNKDIYTVRKDDKKLFDRKSFVSDTEVKTIVEGNDIEYRVTKKQRKGEIYYKIYEGGK
jgi:cold shock CspA family protein